MISPKNKNLGFALFYIASIALIILYFTFLKDKSPLKSTVPQSGFGLAQKEIMNEADLLFNQMKDLQKLDERYSALFVQSEVTPAMDSIDTEISNKEFIFKSIVDSFAGKADALSVGDDKKLFDKFNAFFKQTLENRRTIGNIRYALAAGNFNLDSGQQKLLRMNSDIILKNDRIAELEKQLASNRNFDSGRTAGIVNVSQTLQNSLTDEQQKNTALTNANNLLRENIVSLNGEMEGYRQTIATTKANDDSKAGEVAKETIDAIDTRVEDLNAELQLARVDCNLSRADVKQIISNSRQRKELLSQALGVLNTLSKSDNADIQNKAKAKIRELYRITETVRD